MQTTKTILFTRDTDPVHEGAEFKAGQKETLVITSAERWLRRNAAVEVFAKAEKASEPEAPAKPSEPQAPAKAPAAGTKK